MEKNELRKLAGKIHKVTKENPGAYPSLLVLEVEDVRPRFVNVNNQSFGNLWTEQVQSGYPETWANVCEAIDLLIEWGEARFDDEEGVVHALDIHGELMDKIWE